VKDWVLSFPNRGECEDFPPWLGKRGPSPTVALEGGVWLVCHEKGVPSVEELKKKREGKGEGNYNPGKGGGYGYQGGLLLGTGGH